MLFSKYDLGIIYLYLEFCLSFFPKFVVQCFYCAVWLKWSTEFTAYHYTVFTIISGMEWSSL